MRWLLIVFIGLQMSFCFAQRPNGGRRGPGNGAPNTSAAERPNFESEKVAGFIEYTPKKVLKKLKLKKGDSIAEKTRNYLDIFNASLTALKLENKDLLEGLDVVVNQNMETARTNRNRSLMQETMRMVQEKLKPIRNKIEVLNNQLNTSLEAHLTAAQFEKWKAFEKAENEKTTPKRRQGNDARNRPDDLSGGKRRRG